MTELVEQDHANPKDRVWHDFIKEFVLPVGVVESLERKKVEEEIERERFEADPNYIPEIKYTGLNREALEHQLGELTALYKLIDEGEPTYYRDLLADEIDALKVLYEQAVLEAILQTKLLLATCDMQVATSPDESKARAEEFLKYSELIYGRPSPDLFALFLKNLLSRTSPSEMEGKPDNLKTAAEELRSALSIDEESPLLKRAKRVTKIATADYSENRGLEALSTEIKRAMGRVLQLELPDEISPERAMQIFSDVLHTDLEAERWTVVCDQDTSTRVDQNTKTVHLTQTSRNLEKVLTLIAHELHTHVKRRVAADNSEIVILQLTTAGYLTFEEGLAKTNEALIIDQFPELGNHIYHFAISLTLGLDGTPRNFREVYDILVKYYSFAKLSSDPETTKEDLLAHSKKQAWKACMRVFRGTDFKTKGVCLTKDIVYEEGILKVLRAVNSDADAHTQFYLGKLDPTDPLTYYALTPLKL